MARPFSAKHPSLITASLAPFDPDDTFGRSKMDGMHIHPRIRFEDGTVLMGLNLISSLLTPKAFVSVHPHHRAFFTPSLTAVTYTAVLKYFKLRWAYNTIPCSDPAQAP